jgi:hypothetical protein
VPWWSSPPDRLGVGSLGLASPPPVRCSNRLISSQFSLRSPRSARPLAAAMAFAAAELSRPRAVSGGATCPSPGPVNFTSPLLLPAPASLSLEHYRFAVAIAIYYYSC